MCWGCGVMEAGAGGWRGLGEPIMVVGSRRWVAAARAGRAPAAFGGVLRGRVGPALACPSASGRAGWSVWERYARPGRPDTRGG